MVTNNAINTGKPIEVSNGGTGLSTLTSNALYVGNGTSAPTALTVGTTGQLLVGATGSAPAFASSATGDFTFTTSTAGATRTLTVSNTDNTNASSASLIKASTGGASAGDAQFQATTTTTAWTWGVDNSVTSPTADPWVLAQGTALGTNNVMSVATSGEINYPLQPAFLAVLTAADNDVTGAAAAYTIGTNTALTEIFDQNNDFATNGVFTAPVTGRYLLNFCIGVSGITSAMTRATVSVVTSNRSYFAVDTDPHLITLGTSEFSGNVLADMDAADTASFSITISGGAGNTADIRPRSASVELTWISGYLVA